MTLIVLSIEGVIYALSNSEQMGELNHQKLAQIVALVKIDLA